MFLLAVLIVLAQQTQQSPPKFGTVGVRGAIDGAGYSAPVAEKAESRLASRLPCPRTPEQNDFTQGVALFVQDQPDEARQLFTQGLTACPHSTLLAIGRAALLYHNGYSTEARDAFLYLVKEDPASPEPSSF